mgnify:CR=1 FL=1
MRKLYGREIIKEVKIESCGTFKAISKAEEILEKEGYTWGPVCCNEPIGFAKKTLTSYIAKWRNIPAIEYFKLSGIIVSEDFREGGVEILYFKEIEFPVKKWIVCECEIPEKFVMCNGCTDDGYYIMPDGEVQKK